MMKKKSSAEIGFGESRSEEDRRNATGFSKKENLMLYRRGWRDGATARAKIEIKPPAICLPENYEKGYNDGLAARISADKSACERLNVTTHELLSWVLR